MKLDAPPLPSTKQVDVLFMIDNSNSMELKQKALIDAFPKLIEALRSEKLGPAWPGATCSSTDRSGCKLPDLRVGVITANLGAGPYSYSSCETPGGDQGKLKSKPGSFAPPNCPSPTDPWIAYTAGTSGGVSNVKGSTSSDPVAQLNEAFDCIAYLGPGGCGFEQQLESVHRALDGANPGFLRADSTLLVVLITDEDDCSANKTDLFDPTQQGPGDPLGALSSYRCTRFGLVCDEPLDTIGVKHNCVPGLDYLYATSGYVSFLQSLRPAGNLVVAALSGPLAPFEVGLDGQNLFLKASCGSGTTSSDVPGIRLATVVNGLGASGIYNQGATAAGEQVEVNICASDFGPFLRLIGDRVASLY